MAKKQSKVKDKKRKQKEMPPEKKISAHKMKGGAVEMPQREPDTKHSVIIDHRVLWQDVRERFLDGLKSGDESKLKAVKLAGDGLLNIVKGERQAWGLTKDEAELSEEEVQTLVEAFDEATVPPGKGQALA